MSFVFNAATIGEITAVGENLDSRRRFVISRAAAGYSDAPLWFESEQQLSAFSEQMEADGFVCEAATDLVSENAFCLIITWGVL